MQVLRDLRSFTKILILLELKKQPRLKLRNLASKLDITVQAVSEYLKIMINDSLIEKVNDGYRLTQQGVEFLHYNITSLKKFVDDNIHDLDIINVCTALSHKKLKKGAIVGLTMRNGQLATTKKTKGGSKGTVLYDVEPASDVAIYNLNGIVDFIRGELNLIELPSSISGGSSLIDLKKIRKLIPRSSSVKLAAGDLVSVTVLKKIGLTPDIQFSTLSGSIEAINKGLTVKFLSSTELLPDIISEIEKLNSRSKDKIKYHVIPQENILKK
jgi:putative transcriptional regulator